MKNFADGVERLAVVSDNAGNHKEDIEMLFDAAEYLRLLDRLKYETREVIRGRVNNCERVREVLDDLEEFENRIEAREPKPTHSVIKEFIDKVSEPAEPEPEIDAPVEKQSITPDWARQYPYGGI